MAEKAMILIEWRELETLISEADIVLEVVEARNPLATRCGVVERIVTEKGKDLIIVLNKCDLVPKRVCESWVKFFEFEDVSAICFSSKVMETVGNLKRLIEKRARIRPTIIAVVGYPKVGKSSLVNALKGRNAASTSPYPGTPGYTRRIQRYKIAPGIYLIDTPGMVPAYGNGVELKVRAKPIERIENPIPLAVELIKTIIENNKYAFLDAYGIDSTDPIQILEKLARSRGWFVGREREPNIAEAARAIVRDYFKGKVKYYVMPPTTI